MTTSSSPPPNATNAETIRWAFEMLNRHDVGPLKQFWTDDTVERFPDRTCRGAQEIADYFEDAFAATPDWHAEVLSVAECSPPASWGCSRRRASEMRLARHAFGPDD